MSRSSGVATALMLKGFRVRCVANGAVEDFRRDGLLWTALSAPEDLGDPHEIVLLDSYELTVDRVVEATGAGLFVLMSDSESDALDAGLLVRVAGKPEDGPRRLVGLRYASLRPMFWELSPKRLSERVRRVVVATGGGDADRVGPMVAAALADSLPDADVRHVAGVDSLLPDFAAADLAVSGAGQTILEAAAVGVPTVGLVLAENQRPQADLLASEGLVLIAEPSTVAEAAAEFASSAGTRREMSAAAQAAVDGRGALRIADHIVRLVGSEPT